MSDERNEPPAEDTVPPVAAEPSPVEERLSEAPASARIGRATGAATLWLAGLLVLVIAGVALSPFWAPAVARLLPWGTAPTAADYHALAARVASLEQRPAPPAIDVDAIKSAQAALAERVAGLASAVDALRQNQAEASLTKNALTQLRQRVDTIAAQSSGAAAAATAEAQKFQQQAAQSRAENKELGDRLAAIQHQVQAQLGADRSGSVLLLALLQLREAVEASRPFPAEYAAFKTAAAGDPDLTAAAQPLADAAGSGVPNIAELRQRLADLAAQVAAAAKPPATKSRWWREALDRLQGLITIRHVDGKAETGPEAAIEAAQSALAQNDLGAAIAAVEKLTGADAEAAQPWLRTARRRLAAQAALTHLQALVTTRLGTARTAAPATPAAPGPAAPSPTQLPKTPS
jgi:hypothetical protein